MDAVLELRNIHKSFGKKSVHRGVSFSLRHNEILGLFGGSGTGKSVILRTIIGLERPDKGEVLFHGRPIHNLSERELYPLRTKISYVFQNGALFDSLSVEDNLAYPLREHTKLTPTQQLERVNKMLELVDMKGSNHLLPGALSGGMQKRAGFGRAMILEPEVVLFDEPTAGLDPTNTVRLIQNILRFKERGLTGIFVTHDIPSALALSDRIAILADGKIVVCDTPENLKRSNDPIVRSFLHPEETPA